ncbi:MAG: hypothetical protein ACRDHL_02590, partial [Candidatus Promineifilaceae bacterium]
AGQTGGAAAPGTQGTAADGQGQLQATRAGAQIGAGDEPADAATSTLLLWVGFILALLVFVAAVIGSIILFTRQRTLGR